MAGLNFGSQFGGTTTMGEQQQKQPQQNPFALGPMQQPFQVTQQQAAAAGSTPQRGLASINTGISPTGVYSPQQTQWGVNQALATGAQNADPRYQMKQFGRPGVSQDAGTLAAALPGMAQAQSGAQQQAAQIPLQDAVANQNQLLQGQVASSTAGSGLANALAGTYENNIAMRNAMANPLLQMLGGQMF